MKQLKVTGTRMQERLHVVRESQGKKKLQRSSHAWESDMIIYLREVEC